MAYLQMHDLRQDLEPADLRTAECSRHKPAVLEALQSNDPDWIRAETFNLEALRHRSQKVDDVGEFEVRKQLLRDSHDWKHLEIELLVHYPTNARLDRLIASELAMSRSRLRALHENGLFRTNPDGADVLRRRIKSGVRVTLDLSGMADRELVWTRAVGAHPRP